MIKFSSGNIKYIVLFGAFAVGLWACSAATSGSKIADKPQVIAVYPSGEKVRENLLRISVQFAFGTNQAKLPKLELIGENGKEIEGVFDEQAMWSADGTILTLLLGPGRVKTGFDAHEKLGRALTAGEIVSLAVDGKTVKKWRVIEESNKKIEPNTWEFETPPSSSRNPVLITFDAPIDRMDAGFIAILAPDGTRIDGKATLSEGEKEWLFIPNNSWSPGDYKIVVNSHLEDAYGNSAASAFETSGEFSSAKASVIRLNFRIE